MISLEGDRVSLRPLQPDELETVWDARLGDDTAPWMSTPQAYERLKQRVANSGHFVDGWLDLGIECEGRLVGEIDARQPPRSMPQGVYELGISLFETSDRGRGLGTDAIRLLTRYLFEHEEAARVQASTWVENTAMRRVFEKLGFTAGRRSPLVHAVSAGPGRLRPVRDHRGRARVRFGHVLVVGAGQMGGGIAQVMAASGRRVSLHDAAPGAVERGLETMRKSLTRLAEKGGADPDEVLARVEPVADLVPADLMVEAVVEDAAVKEGVFRRADEVLPNEAVLASNTSSIPIGSLAAATSRPDRVIGMHFFNPVPVLQLVEVVRGSETSDETAEAITELARELGKTPAVANDFPGFVSNRILMPYINEAVWALHEGVAEPEAIDTIAKLGFNHPMGPLALADLIGLDTCVAIMEVLRDGLGETRYEPCPLLRNLVDAGKLGRKSGAGFYIY